MARKRILIVDDDPCLRQVVDFKLRLSNFDTTLKSSVRDAIEFIRDECPDLIILDLAFEEEKLNGFDFLRIVRENPQTANIPVIILSVLSSPQNIHRGVELGASDFLGKPFSVNVLVDKVHSMVGA
ncbi:MAG TPA: response regulator [Thermoanaerobaculia bacterium]|nr:response regulator [Thermoanaerobaculia bacterium]HUM30353.1 response regulator [Thermoanaerobaculia bacterium]HXK68496.1 response regulator [Thermoanaerobaculia bacterium]